MVHHVDAIHTHCSPVVIHNTSPVISAFENEYIKVFSGIERTARSAARFGGVDPTFSPVIAYAISFYGGADISPLSV